MRKIRLIDGPEIKMGVGLYHRARLIQSIVPSPVNPFLLDVFIDGRLSESVPLSALNRIVYTEGQ
ncbi:MAG: hypothetical protein VYB54_04860 [Pseudomonadota bacterium]|nr:hypothetical protein [Pseudomonadota bacterium]